MLEADLDHLHLTSKTDRALRDAGFRSIGDLVTGPETPIAARNAVGTEGSRQVRDSLGTLEAFTVDGHVDWQGYWRQRGVAVVPDVVVGDPDVPALAHATPLLLRAALRDGAWKGTDPDRDWVIIDGRNGLVSQSRTLDELGSDVLALTRERVRQLEQRAMRRLALAWDRRFVGSSYRLNPDLEPALISLRETIEAIEGLVLESRLFEWLGYAQVPTGHDLRRVAFLLGLAGLGRIDADGERRTAMWAPEGDPGARSRVALADRVGRLLTQEIGDPVSAVDIAAALNRQRQGGRVALAAVERVLPITPLVEPLGDGRWQGKFEYLTRRGDQAYRLIDAAGKPVDLDIVAREINARTAGKPVEVRNLSNQLSGDRRFVAIGKSGLWGLADRDGAAAVSILEVLVGALRSAGRPLTTAELQAAVEARRPAKETSVSMYLGMRSEFTQLEDRRWALASWPEARSKGRKKEGRPRGAVTEAVTAAGIHALELAPGNELELKDLITSVAAQTGLKRDTIYQFIERGEAFERRDREGRRFVHLVPEPRRGRDTGTSSNSGRKARLPERIAQVVIPYLAASPGGERPLSDVVGYVSQELHIVPNSLYGYLRRVPGVVRVDEPGRKVVRLVTPPTVTSNEWPLPATAERVRSMIAIGELPDVEFKSTLRWSVKADRDDPDVLNKMVTKTIAAFANSHGGTLLVGVEPEGGIYGIERDAAIVQKKGDSVIDTFSLYLTEVCKNHLGLSVAGYAATQYVDIDGHAVCVIDVRRSPEPVYLTTKKQTEKVTAKGTEKVTERVTEFYVRVGTSSHALPVEDIAGYIRSHWQ